MERERTLFLVKPDAVQRGLAGEIIKRLESRGLKLVGLKLMQVTRPIAEKHYAEHKGKPFFPGLIEYMTSGPVLVMVWEGENIIAAMRTMMGATNPANAAPGTIRGDLATEMQNNVSHGSDSPESAAREISIFFPDLDA